MQTVFSTPRCVFCSHAGCKILLHRSVHLRPIWTGFFPLSRCSYGKSGQHVSTKVLKGQARNTLLRLQRITQGGVQNATWGYQPLKFELALPEERTCHSVALVALGSSTAKHGQSQSSWKETGIWFARFTRSPIIRHRYRQPVKAHILLWQVQRSKLRWWLGSSWRIRDGGSLQAVDWAETRWVEAAAEADRDGTKWFEYGGAEKGFYKAHT